MWHGKASIQPRPLFVGCEVDEHFHILVHTLSVSKLVEILSGLLLVVVPAKQIPVVVLVWKHS